jgi:hypothetical protein
MLVRAHKMHDSFVVQMEATRDAVVEILMWEIGSLSDSQKSLIERSIYL